MIERLDVTSPKEKVFWSGNKKEAGKYAQRNGKTILEQTSGGKVLDEWKEMKDTFSWNKDDMEPHGWDFWGDISENYALDAKGNINTIQTIEKFPAGGQIWKSKEWPVLYENPNVKDITINKIDDTGKIIESLTVDSKRKDALNIFGIPK